MGPTSAETISKEITATQSIHGIETSARLCSCEVELGDASLKLNASLYCLKGLAPASCDARVLCKEANSLPDFGMFA
jgi:hypothetical protein